MLSKTKPDKIKYLDVKHTLAEKYNEHVNKFTNDKNSIPDKKRSIKEMTAELELLNNSTNFTDTIINKRAILKESIERLKNEIINIKKGSIEVDFYYKTNDIVMDYFDIIENADDNNNNNEIKINRNKKPTEIEDRLTKMNKLSQLKRKIKKVPKKRVQHTGELKLEPKNILNFFIKPIIKT